MSLDEIILAIGIAIFSAGLYLMPDRPIWGSGFTLIGIALLSYSARSHLAALYERFGVPHPVLALLIVALLGATLFCGAWLAVGILKGGTVPAPEPTAAPTVGPPPKAMGLLFSPQWGAFPIGVPPHGSLLVLELHPNNPKDYPFEWQPGSANAVIWPRKGDEIEGEPVGDFHFKCEVTNYGEVNLVDVDLPIPVDFLDGDKVVLSRLYHVRLPALYANGGSARFHIVNISSLTAFVTFPKTGTGIVPGELNPRIIHVTRSQEACPMPLMGSRWPLGPTNLHWLGLEGLR